MTAASSERKTTCVRKTYGEMETNRSKNIGTKINPETNIVAISHLKTLDATKSETESSANKTPATKTKERNKTSTRTKFAIKTPATIMPARAVVLAEEVVTASPN